MFLSTLVFLASVITNTSSEAIYNKAYVELKAQEYGVDVNRINKIVNCESNFRNEDIVGDHGLAYGLFQYHFLTFETYKKKYGKTWLQYKSMEDQTELAMMMMARGEWKHWSCDR